jgi:tetratricopeptide (TPR) repeat protein
MRIQGKFLFSTCITVILFLTIFQIVYAGSGSKSSFKNPKDLSFLLYSSDDTAKINWYVRKANSYMEKAKLPPEIVKTYLDSAVQFCKKKEIEIPAEVHFLEGRFYYETGDFSRAEEEFNSGQIKAESENNYQLLSRILLFKGRYYLRIGFFEDSHEAFMKSIQIANENNIRGIIQASYEGIANVLNAAGDIIGYRNYLKLMISTSFKEKDTLSAESGLQRLGNSYIDYKRDLRKADSAFRKCLEISLIKKDTFYTGFSSANIGWVHYLEKNYDSAIYYYEKSLKYSIKGKQVGISSNSLGNLGTIYRDLGDRSKAIGFYMKSLKQANMNNDWYTLSWVYNDMSKLYLDAGDTSRAYNNYVLYKLYNDSVLLRKNNQGLADARIRYEADNHKKEIDLLSMHLKNNRLLNYGFAGLIILTILITFLITSRAKINSKRRISEMNNRISELTQANLRQQMNPHFIFNTLNSIQYFMYQHDKLATNDYLTKFSNLMRKVLENSQHTTVSLQDELDALNLYLELESLRFKDKFDYSIVVDEEIDPVLYKVPAMLIQPYVENSICHGLMPLDHKGYLYIGIRHEKDCLVCTIEDNGIGREAGIERKKSKNDGSNSLGTQITGSRLDLLNSLYGSSQFIITYNDLKNDKGEAAGTHVEIQIPIMT